MAVLYFCRYESLGSGTYSTVYCGLAASKRLISSSKIGLDVGLPSWYQNTMLDLSSADATTASDRSSARQRTSESNRDNFFIGYTSIVFL
jgi:hypothetical protein